MDSIVVGRISGAGSGGVVTPVTVPIFMASANLTFNTSNGTIASGYIDIDRNRDLQPDSGQRVAAGATFIGNGYTRYVDGNALVFQFDGDLIFPANGVVSATGTRTL